MRSPTQSVSASASRSRRRAPASTLGQAVRLLQRLADSFEDDPLQTYRWLPPQHAFLSARGKRVLLRAGNQVYGKTTVGLAELVYRAIGRHPLKPVRPPPIEAWVICVSWSQSVAIQRKLWALAPRRALQPGQTCDTRNGFGAKSPALRFRNGSVIWFKTSKQDSLDLASATIDVILFDEPPSSERVFNEVLNRVRATNGDILLTLTPINRPVDYLKKLCDEEVVKDLHFRLTPENLIPVGTQEPYRLKDGTPCDEAWVKRTEEESPAHEREITVHGGWEGRAVDRVFTAFTDAHITTQLPPPDARAGLGIDHGKGKGKEAAVLLAVQDAPPGGYPVVWVVDEYVSDGDTTAEQDVDSILAMLKRNGLAWADLSFVVGDRVVGGRNDVGRKGNRDLEDALVKRLRVVRREALKPRIWTSKRGARRGAGSVAIGVRWVHRQTLRPGHFRVDARCTTVISSMRRWDGKEDSEHKHVLDALRYGLDAYIFGRRRVAGTSISLE